MRFPDTLASSHWRDFPLAVPRGCSGLSARRNRQDWLVPEWCPRRVPFVSGISCLTRSASLPIGRLTGTSRRNDSSRPGRAGADRIADCFRAQKSSQKIDVVLSLDYGSHIDGQSCEHIPASYRLPTSVDENSTRLASSSSLTDSAVCHLTHRIWKRSPRPAIVACESTKGRTGLCICICAVGQRRRDPDVGGLSSTDADNSNACPYNPMNSLRCRVHRRHWSLGC